MPTSDSESNYHVRTIRISDDEVAALLNNLDEVEPKEYQGRATRFHYRTKALVIHLHQPGATSSTAYLVPSRNISATGVSFLHGGYVHVGSECSVQLITSYGTWNNVQGVVRRCAHVQGNVHEVGVSFSSQIDPSLYTAEAIQHRVLLVDDDELMSSMTQKLLEKLNAMVDHASNGKLALELAAKTEYDIILLDMIMPELDGFATAKELRRCGYGGCIVAMTSLNTEQQPNRCFEAGCDRFLAKPIRREHLEELLQQLHQEPLYSAYHDEKDFADVLLNFARELSKRLRVLEEAVGNRDVESLTKIVRKLRVEGASYGFEPITESAETIETALAQGKQVSDLLNQVNGLMQLCMQASASQRSATLRAARENASSK